MPRFSRFFCFVTVGTELELELDCFCFCPGEDYCRRLTVQNSVLLDRTDSTKVQIHPYIPSGLLRSIHASQLTSSSSSKALLRGPLPRCRQPPAGEAQTEKPVSQRGFRLLELGSRLELVGFQHDDGPDSGCPTWDVN